MNAGRNAVFAKAMRLLDDGRAKEALEIGERFVLSDDEGDRLSGYLCRGLAYEDGGQDLQPDVEKAIHNYRQAALIIPDPISFCHLARASMKAGTGDGYEAAFKYLQEAARTSLTPEVALGFAQYYRTKSGSDLDLAKKFYLKAAVRGRFGGFFGYSEVAREAGQNVRAFAVDCIRIALGPLMALLLGRRAQDRF